MIRDVTNYLLFGPDAYEDNQSYAERLEKVYRKFEKSAQYSPLTLFRITFLNGIQHHRCKKLYFDNSHMIEVVMKDNIARMCNHAEMAQEVAVMQC